jgi:hypothetical protein
MEGRIARLTVAGVVLALAGRSASAVTREVANVPAFRLTFGDSVLNQLTYDTYRTAYDELQTRPYNLLFAGIGRHANLSPWPGQEGGYARYVDALIGNNGAANVDNNADAIQGTMIRRQTGKIAWGVTAAFLAGTLESDDTNGASTFSDGDDLKGVDVRGAAAFQLGERRVLGGGLRLLYATSSITEDSFEAGVGGFSSEDSFDQIGVIVDAGLRTFLDPRSSWEIAGALSYGTPSVDEKSTSFDAAGAPTGTFVTSNYDIDDLSFTVTGSYNRLRADSPGETEYRGGLTYAQREIGNSNLGTTLTLLSQDPIKTTAVFGSAKSIFQAGETEMFVGARLGYAMVDGATQVDAGGTPSSESIDDTQADLRLTLGVRQPLYRDKLRFIASGRGDVLRIETKTGFDTGDNGDTATLTVAQYAIGLEAVLANVTLDLAWLAGEEAAVVPVPIGVPSGARRTVELDRLVFSAAVSW